MPLSFEWAVMLTATFFVFVSASQVLLVGYYVFNERNGWFPPVYTVLTGSASVLAAVAFSVFVASSEMLGLAALATVVVTGLTTLVGFAIADDVFTPTG